MKNKKQINDLLSISAAYNDSGLFIGLRLRINGVEETLETTSELLIFAEESSLEGFRCGNEFTPRLGEEIAYKKVTLVEESTYPDELRQCITKVLNEEGVCLDPNVDDCGEFVSEVSTALFKAIKSIPEEPSNEK